MKLASVTARLRNVGERRRFVGVESNRKFRAITRKNGLQLGTHVAEHDELSSLDHRRESLSVCRSKRFKMLDGRNGIRIALVNVYGTPIFSNVTLEAQGARFMSDGSRHFCG